LHRAGPTATNGPRLPGGVVRSTHRLRDRWAPAPGSNRWAV